MSPYTIVPLGLLWGRAAAPDLGPLYEDSPHHCSSLIQDGAHIGEHPVCGTVAIHVNHGWKGGP